MPADAHVNPPADWYLDPEDRTRGRYWDGAAWTDDTVDVPDGLTLSTFPPTQRERQPRGRTLLVAAAVVVVAVVAAAAGWWATSGTGDGATRVAGVSVMRLRGSVDLDDPAYLGGEAGSSCEGEGDLSDVVAGLPVRVRTGDGAAVVTAHLRSGRLVPSDDAATISVPAQPPAGLGALMPSCRLSFRCEVPVADRYRIEVEGYGSESWSRAELEADGWTVRLALTA